MLVLDLPQGDVAGQVEDPRGLIDRIPRDACRLGGTGGTGGIWSARPTQRVKAGQGRSRQVKAGPEVGEPCKPWTQALCDLAVLTTQGLHRSALLRELLMWHDAPDRTGYDWVVVCWFTSKL